MKESILQRLEALERRLNKLNIRGVISEIDTNRGAGGCVRINYGDNQLSDWLPVKPLRSGGSSIWWFPDVGESVTVTDLETGEVLPGSFNSDNPPPSRDPDVLYIKFKDESFISHNRSDGNFAAEFKGKSVVTIGSDSTLNVAGKTIINSDDDTTINCKKSVKINSKSKDIQLNGGAGVVTGAHVCAFTGLPHSDCSSEVKAAK